MLWLLAVVFSVADANTTGLVRTCVLSNLADSCAEMARDLPETFACAVAPDTYGCLEKITNGEADVTAVDPNGLFLGGKYFNLKPIITELVDGESYIYQGIALVAKDDPAIQSVNDLKGKRSCHTGFWRTVGWQIPISKLLAGNVMEPSCEEGELAAANNFFGGSCLAGNWSMDPVLDSILKHRYSKLCSQCKNPETCAVDDHHYGYEGAIRCLTDGYGDVAFTKIPVLRDYLEKDPSLAEKVELLCFEGGRKSVNDSEPCTWGLRPTNTYVSREDSEEETERIANIILQVQSRYSIPKVSTPDWYYKTFLTHPKVSGIRKTVENRRNYVSYLGDFIHTIRKPRPGCVQEESYDISFCVTSDEEESKCIDYSRAADARGIWPHVQCVRNISKAGCMETVKEGNAHLLVLDAGDAYSGVIRYNLEALAGELYGNLDAAYYAVAVQRSESNVTKLRDLRDLSSCHAGIDSISSWSMPITTLMMDGHLPFKGFCNFEGIVADFFSTGSCVPGANDTKYNPQKLRSEDLCKQCVGDEQGLHRCALDSHERYSGYSGAFRCLAEDKGNVAFVKHTTVPEYTDGHSALEWSKDLLSSDFRLLCPKGGTAPISDYLTCNLGKVPSHHVMTKKGVAVERRLNFVSLLADSSHYFNHESTLFKLFFKRHSADLLFKDSTTGLKITPFDSYYVNVLGQEFCEASYLFDSENCEEISFSDLDNLDTYF